MRSERTKAELPILFRHVIQTCSEHTPNNKAHQYKISKKAVSEICNKRQ